MAHTASLAPGTNGSFREDRLDGDHLVAISCACGRTLISGTRPGLVAQVTSHWRLRHREPIAITPAEFVRRHAFPAWEGD